MNRSGAWSSSIRRRVNDAGDEPDDRSVRTEPAVGVMNRSQLRPALIALLAITSLSVASTTLETSLTTDPDVHRGRRRAIQRRWGR